jgi:acyl dehydratase
VLDSLLRAERASLNTMNLAEFEGRIYGALPWRVAPDAVGDFVEVTGDDHERWSSLAPPGFAAAALFAVAPDLLAELYQHSVIHGEQTFAWKGPITIGDLVDVTGTVTRVRERGGVFFVTFEMTAGSILSGTSLFLASGEAIPAGEPGFERPEPPHGYRGEPGEGELSASRADLIRYASATRDWNPVHWDHEAAVAAGFPGVVVHGLLQAGWALRVFTEANQVSPRSARFRFRNPLLPARPIGVSVEGVQVTLSDVDTEYLTATISTSDE